ncbi:QcrA and Rieske domain-containing protein [Paenibacillus sp. 481]|uniref:QcrA and Rieske domain-containing protein n=1 Tax=Paenibacillus sp. 481 TaxID=2835869 RepID=UPI001E61AC97|nr:ubiquinol-cytochrome c reductase iron-sulfur subunit [Paenibacillus sp. 481]UHA72982.1 ubiquinol-cytochrome c reductase iron-sulfur subunit [Paenibacillus sp. 481]
MSNPHEIEHKPHKARKEMSRRQFLAYTLGGTTAFMAAGAALPMIRFAVDPLLQKKGGETFVKVVEVAKITNEPQEFNFELTRFDGWYEDKATMTAWVRKDENNNIYALSPICKHLGCTVDWNGSASHKDQYFCQCHGAHYTKDGKQQAVALAPLDDYNIKIENGFVYLGQVVPNKRV